MVLTREINRLTDRKINLPFATVRRKVPPRMLSFILLALLAHALPIKCQNLQQKFNIIILAGQSNMAGRGGVANDTATGIPRWDGDVPPQCQPNPSIFRLSADMAWVRAREPIHVDIDARKTDGIGPGMSFANAILTKDPNIGFVGLVPCAVGGTTISEWQKGEFLYKQLVKRAQMARQSGGIYKAMLWYQGETDTINQEDVGLYKGRLKRFFNDLRSDLQAPMLPIFQVALASGQGPYIEKVREAQLNIGLPNVKCVDAKGLPLQPDGLHLTTPAQDRVTTNMAGKGGVPDGKWDGSVPSECQPNPSILRLTANLTWEEASDPLHVDNDVGRIRGVGPGMAFANEIRTHGSGIGVVGLVPCAAGGTSISKWPRGRRVNASLKDGGAIRAILCYQGESDTGTKENAEAYKGKLEKLIQDFRSDLNLPSLPFIQVALASGEGEIVETVRKAQMEINLPNVGSCISRFLCTFALIKSL